MDARKHLTRDGLFGVCVVVLAAAYLLMTPVQVSSVTDGFENLTGRTFPYIIGTATLLLGLMLAVRSFSALKRVPKSPDAAGETPGSGARKVAYYTVAIMLYTVCMGTIGYVVSTAGMLAYAMWATGARDKRIIAAAVVVVPPLIYWVFHYVMQIPFPDALLL